MPDISFENVSYVPLLLVYGVDIGRHNAMILPNRSSNGNKSSGFGLEKSYTLKQNSLLKAIFTELESVTYHEKRKLP